MKRLFSSTVLLALLLCGTAGADFVYTTENGTLGHISVESTAGSFDITASPSVVSGLSGDLFLTAWNKGDDQVAVIQSGGTAEDAARIYTSRKWSEPAEVTLTGVKDASGLAVSNNGNSFFVASRANGRIVEFSLNSPYSLKGRSYDIPVPEGQTAYAEDVAIHGNTVYGLFSFSGTGKGKLVALDGLLSSRTLRASFDVDSGATDLAATDKGQIGIAGSGGLEYLSGGKVTSLVSGDAYGSVSALCRDKSNGLYFIGRKTSDGTTNNTLYHWDSAIETLPFTGTGEHSALAWDTKNNILAMMTEDKVQLINSDGVLERELSSATLGGTLTSLVFLPRSSTRDDGRKDSGCDVLGAGLFSLFLPLAFLGHGRHKRR